MFAFANDTGGNVPRYCVVCEKILASALIIHHLEMLCHQHNYV